MWHSTRLSCLSSHCLTRHSLAQCLTSVHTLRLLTNGLVASSGPARSWNPLPARVCDKERQPAAYLGVISGIRVVLVIPLGSESEVCNKTSVPILEFNR